MTDKLREILREELKPLRMEIRETKNLITGNGTPERGLTVRVDRLEQSEKAKKFWLRTSVVLGLSSLLAMIRNILW